MWNPIHGDPTSHRGAIMLLGPWSSQHSSTGCQVEEGEVVVTTNLPMGFRGGKVSSQYSYKRGWEVSYGGTTLLIVS